SQEVSGKSAEHEHVTVGEVDEAQDSINHRVPKGDQRVNGTQRQAVDELLQKPIHAAAKSRIDGFDQFKLSVFDLKDDHGLGGVPLFIDSYFPADTIKIFDGCQLLANFWPFHAAGL